MLPGKCCDYVRAEGKRIGKPSACAVLEPDEIEALLNGRKDRAKNGTISHDAINWD